MGVTGARASLGDAASVIVSRTKAVTDKPVCVGLGVSTREQAAEVAAFADGVIVGSALVRCLTEADDLAVGISRLREVVSGSPPEFARAPGYECSLTRGQAGTGSRCGAPTPGRRRPGWHGSCSAA